MRRPLRPVTLLCLLGTGALHAQGGTPLLSEDFEVGSPYRWSRPVGLAPPVEVCARPITPVDTTSATVVGNGSPGSCTEAALNAALATNNGMIRFSCGGTGHTIVVTSEKTVTTSLVLDGGGRVTLSGGGLTRILALRPPFGTVPQPTLTVQNLAFANGSTASLPGGTVTSGGAAIYRDQGGNLRVLDCFFTDNVGPASGQDVAGGAIYSFGSGTTTIVGSTFAINRASSGGALGNLGNDLTVVNSTLIANAATGSGGNPGNGGNGGGIYMDGDSQTVSLCGVSVVGNDANARGAGIFRVANNGVGAMTIDRSTIAGNEIPANAESQAGGLYLQGLQTTITASTVANNVASSTGGIFVWTNPGSQTLAMTNVTVAGNHARTGLGAGMAVASGVTGTLHHVTLARNSNEGAASFASALAGGQGLTVTNSLIADNTKVFIWENTSCNATHFGTGNLQWPSQNAGGQAELACAGVTFLDPGLGALVSNGGPTRTILPANPVVHGAGTASCPATDQRGLPRPQPCTPGAVELP